MTATSIPTDGLNQIGARMGESLIRRMANAQAEVVGQQPFAVHLLDAPGLSVTGGISSQSRTLRVRALASEVPAAAVEGVSILLNGDEYVIAIDPVLDTRMGIVQFDVERA